MSHPTISVIIPVKNEAKKIAACIEGILQQTVKVLEIIVIDSGSTDGTIEILKNYPIVKVLQIPSEEFNHGLTRNFGIQHASGEYILMTVGDARPYNNYWIEELLKGFEDEKVAGVCGQQVVPHDKTCNPVDWFNPVNKNGTYNKYQYTREQFQKLQPAEIKEACSWDDVTAMYKASIMQIIPFKKTVYSEDALWAMDAIMAGYSLVYNTRAKVYHYHLENAEFAFKRTLTTFYFRYRHFGYVYPLKKISLRNRLSIFKSLLTNPKINIAEKFKWWKYNKTIRRSRFKALEVFHNALNISEEALDEMHQQYCSRPPIPLK